MTSLQRGDRAFPRPGRPIGLRVLGAWAGVLTLLVGGCTGGEVSLPGQGSTDAVRQAAAALAAALSKRDVSALGWSQLTGAQAQSDYLATVAPLGTVTLAAAVGEAKANGSTASATLQLAWTFPGVKQTWAYSVTATFSKAGDAWQPVWASTLVQPDLTGGGRLRMERSQGTRGKILAGDGSALMSERAVVRIGIDKTRVSGTAATTSATALARLVGVDAKTYAASVKSAGAQAFVVAITYRANAADRPSASRLRSILGALAVDGTAVLSPRRGFAEALLGQVGNASKEVIDASQGTLAAGDQVGLTGLERRYESRLGGTPGVTVSLVPGTSAGASPGGSAGPTTGSSPSAEPSGTSSAAPARQLFAVAPTDGSDLKLTMSTKLQTLAERLLADVKPDSALVAVKPSTGQILAAASGPGADGANSATFGRYPPGSTFKLASSLALLRSGMTPSSPVSCPKTLVVNGQTFKNYSDYPSSRLGRIDLKTAVANSCNTAFIGSRGKLGDGDLTAAAASLGIGTDYDVGFPAFYGSVPQPGSPNELAASMIGQAKVEASPMAMAGAIASAMAGRTVLPYLVDGQQPTSKAKPLTTTEAAQLRTMLAAVVSEGSGGRLKAVEPPAVIAKTGTAEFGTAKPPKTHAWMVAAQGDLAVCVFVGLGDSGSQTAGPILQEFLQQA